tara:strand:- start:640 stop:810 length:171 start_codon:yes stop_codon:yes gene_type:complete
MDTIYLVLIIVGSFFAGMKLKCKSKCCGCEFDMEKSEDENGNILRTLKVIKRTDTM